MNKASHLYEQALEAKQEPISKLRSKPRSRKNSKTKAPKNKNETKEVVSDLPWARGPHRISFLTTFGFLPNLTLVEYAYNEQSSKKSENKCSCPKEADVDPDVIENVEIGLVSY